MPRLQDMDPFWKGVTSWALVAAVVNPLVALFFGAAVYSIAERTDRTKPVD